MEFWQDYGLFLLKTVTILSAVIALIAFIIAQSSRGHQHGRERLEVRRLNERYQAMEHEVQRKQLGRKQFRKLVRDQNKQRRKEMARDERKRIFVINFHGDIRASQVECLRQEVSAILTVARPEDEVLLRLETGGGMMHAYGLAASQLVRLRERDIPLTVAVDKVAASGGYMMACVANRVLAAPFAIIGSIGVIAQLPNFHRLLEKHDIDFEQITAGEYKRTLTVFGENTEQARTKFRQDIEEAHTHFKEFIRRYRPSVDIEEVATGEHWFGLRARELGLVDELTTSDDYMLDATREATLLELNYRHKEPLRRRLALFAEDALSRLLPRPS